MIPLRIALTGFLSYREEQTLHFDDSVLWILSGPNGVGKSAIFDAITYALYEHHRAGTKNDAKDLINHYEDELRVEFDFLVDGKAYRIVRTCKRRGRATRAAFRLSRSNGNDWSAQLLKGTEDDKGFKAWVEHTIGLNYEAFTSSVLLLQGQSERLLHAQPKERYTVLAELIDLSPYQKLHELADQQRKQFKAQVQTLEHQLQAASISAIDEENVTSTFALLKQAEAEWKTTQAEVEELTRMLEQARSRERLIREREEQQQALRNMYTLLTQENEIRQRQTEFQELQVVVPKVSDLVEQRQRLAEKAQHISQFQIALQQRIAGIAQAVDSASLHSQLQNDNATHERLLRELGDVREREQQCLQEKTIAQFRYEDAGRRLANFEGSTYCELCGQPITAEHAHSQQASLQEQREKIRQVYDEANRNHQEIQEHRQQLEMQQQELAVRVNHLMEVCTSSEVTALEIEKGVQQEIEHSMHSMLLSLPEAWQERVKVLDANGLVELKLRRDELAAYEQQYKQLEHADQTKTMLEQRIDKLNEQIDAYPVVAHQSVGEIEQELSSKKDTRTRADRKRALIRDTVATLEAQREQQRLLQEQKRVAERQYSLYNQLSGLLGRDDLQLHLLSQAEQAIVEIANGILDGLSHGTMRLELRRESDATAAEKALDLVVHNYETGGQPTAVSLVSGSQKFRIAMSLALAIGRYSSKASRNVESVIIDEGFGSLDKSGRDDMIQSLNALRHQLQRIILVSHQEEFARAFPNRYGFALVDGSSHVTLLTGD